MHFTFWPWGLTPGPKFTKIGADLLPTQVYHPAKCHHPVSTHAKDSHYKTFADTRTKKEANQHWTIYPQHTYGHVGIINLRRSSLSSEKFILASHWLWDSAGLKMPIHVHFFQRAILTGKVGQTDIGFGVRSAFISRSLRARSQVSVCSSYDLCHSC